jgi:hypothetical protein
MTIYVYKVGYVEPDPPVKSVLTPAQREAVKTKMQERVDNKGKVPIKELIDLATAHALSLGKHIHDSVFKEIALEIRAENGTPEVSE